jgi:type IV pilus assembly protein PilM
MLRAKSFLCIDCGAGSLKAAEFEPNDSGSLRLKQYALKPLGPEASQDATREATLLKAIQELLAEGKFSSRNVNICAPGYQVFNKIVKLPPVEDAKIAQIIEHEAQVNVPFPLDEVVWDYEIIGNATGGEVEVLLAAVKSDVVESLLRTSDAAGLKLNLVDISNAAMCNAFRFNYGDLEGCTLILDIGFKTSNVLFFEKGKVYSRSINIGGGAITQDFAAESKLPYNDAEKLKIDEGFVSLGGAYEEPDNPQQAAISKIARQVMTRLHIQMNQTIQFYRQQGGSAPQRMFLAGGASMLPYTAQFFSEKLNVPVDYFNPFRNLQFDEEINLEEFAKVAHVFGEVVGLGIRNLAECPVDLNLMPKTHRKRKDLAQKTPYFVATVFSLVAVVFACGWFFNLEADATQKTLERIRQSVKLEELIQNEKDLDEVKQRLVRSYQRAEGYLGILEGRYNWIDLIQATKGVLIQAEDSVTNAPCGVWIESFTPLVPDFSQQAASPYIHYISIKCKAMNLAGLSPDANTKFVFALEQSFKTNAVFVAEGTALAEKIDNVAQDALTFGFGLTLRVKKPIKLN